MVGLDPAIHGCAVKYKERRRCRHRAGHDDWAVLIIGEPILPRPGITVLNTSEVGCRLYENALAQKMRRPYGCTAIWQAAHMVARRKLRGPVVEDVLSVGNYSSRPGKVINWTRSSTEKVLIDAPRLDLAHAAQAPCARRLFAFSVQLRVHSEKLRVNLLASPPLRASGRSQRGQPTA
jgi:hypothetical protein